MIRDLNDDEARCALPLKWGDVEPGGLPAWVAEMDYRPADAVQEALVAAVRMGIGYPPHGRDGLGEAFAGFARRHWDWDVPAEASVPTGSVMGGIRLALDAACPPGPVVVPLPCYPPFRDVVAVTGRELVPVELDPDVDRAVLDLEQVERAFAGGARTFLLCSPHNPLGRVWSREELQGLADLARAYDARVVADEVHAPLTLPGARFTPYLSVDDRAILVTSATKSFNMPGVGAAQFLVLDPQLHALLSALPIPAQNAWSSLGVVALRAAWNDGDPWLAALLERLDAQRTLLGELLAEHLPEARMRPLEATYLPWVDLRAYGVADPAGAAERHGVRLGAGDHYHPGLPGHVRINIATDAPRLTEIVRRTAAALTDGSSA